MRGDDKQQLDVFSYVSPEQRVPQDHPLRSLRAMTDEALQQLRPRFNRLYAKTGRPSIAPEKLLRALLLQGLYSVRSERLLMEQLDYNLLFRWFVGLMYRKNKNPFQSKSFKSGPMNIRPEASPRQEASRVRGARARSRRTTTSSP